MRRKDSATKDGFSSTFGFFFKIWIVYALFVLALSIGVIYVAIHFLAKFW